MSRDKLRLTDDQMRERITRCDKSLAQSGDLIKVAGILDGFGGDIKLQRGLVDRMRVTINDIDFIDGFEAADEFRTLLRASEELVDSRAAVDKAWEAAPLGPEDLRKLTEARRRLDRAIPVFIRERERIRVTDAFRIVQCIVGDEELNSLVALKTLSGEL